MRQLVLTTVLALVAFGAVLPVSAPRAAPSCDFVGTKDRDVFAGGMASETICLLGGHDYAHGNGGNDRIRGGTGMDALIGGAGRDKLKGGPADDRLFAIDQRLGNDLIRGGAGFDRCYADPGDVVRGCEQTHRGNTAETTEALSVNSLQVTEIAEDALEEVVASPEPTPPPGPSAPPCPPAEACD